MEDPSPHQDSEIMTPRSYQLEVLDQTMAGNTIVAMDTGSGKTQVAVLRIQEELKRCPLDQIVWFLAPKVVLCEQQHLVLKRQLSAYQHLFLCGADGVDKWSTQHLWDAVLKNVRVVCSTPRVLLDALDHGFVKLTCIALLVIDEAHGARSNSETNTIMLGHYHRKENHACRPHILALTASPVMKSNPSELADLKNNLDSCVTTPRVHRSDLMKHVNRPVAKTVIYCKKSWQVTPVVSRLRDAVATYKTMQDPYVQELLNSKRQSDKCQMEKVIAKESTWCLQQLKAILRRASDIAADVGPPLADRYVLECTKKLACSAARDSDILVEWTTEEKQHLMNILNEVIPCADDVAKHNVFASDISEKAQKLIDVLTMLPCQSLVCLVFAQQRATVWALTQFLRMYRETQHLRVGAFVGTSLYMNRKANISDVADLKLQQQSLDDFRDSKLDLIVSTDVLSEGIDVPAANVVICFDQPQNLVSYVQRRGRARQMESHYYIFTVAFSSRSKDWEALEDAMIEAYLEEKQQTQAVLEAEAVPELTGPWKQEFCIESTRAVLTHENANAHLHHLCQSVGGIGPRFAIKESEGEELRKAYAILPITIVDPSLRTTESTFWRTEKAAKRHAAFEAYVRLYKAGLVNDNLMPVLDQDLDEDSTEELKPSLCTVSGRVNVWRKCAQLWRADKFLQSVRILIKRGDELLVGVSMVLPRLVQSILRRTSLHWDETTLYTMIPCERAQEALSKSELSNAQQATNIFLSSVFSNRMIGYGSDFVVLFVPTKDSDQGITDLSSWKQAFQGSYPASNSLVNGLAGSLTLSVDEEDLGLIWYTRQYGARYFFKNVGYALPDPGAPIYDPRSSDGQGEVACIGATRFPKRRDFLHPLSESNMQPQHISYTNIYKLPLSDCSVDRLPARYALLALMVPSILHIQEITLVAEELRSGLLAPLNIQNLDFALTAICASSAREETDYQRQEFLGDCILKFLTTLHLMVSHPTWPESYLTRTKSRMVSNSTLASAALRTGLDRFILTEPFTGAKWRPIYIEEEIAAAEPATRQMSSKILADVVEALIGAAYLDGAAENPSSTPWSDAGLEKAVKCLRIFFPNVQWLSYSEMLRELQSNALDPPHIDSKTSSDPSKPKNTKTKIPAPPSEPERLLDHTFTSKPLLASALTHPSYNIPNHTGLDPESDIRTMTAQCYQRLEFLGDALLDYIITTKLFAHSPPLPHHKMHLFRSACVSGDTLAFLCLEHRISIPRSKVVTTTKRPPTAARNPEHDFAVQETLEQMALWRYMQHDHSPALIRQQTRLLASHARHGGAVAEALREGGRFPWAGLARLRAPKFVSDIVESCLAAVWIDSGCVVGGDCAGFVDVLGVGEVWRRLVDGGVWALHPKEDMGQLVGRIPAGVGGVRYETVAVVSEADDDDGVRGERRVDEEGWLECRLFVGDVEIARAGKGRSKFEVETLAAEESVLRWDEVGGGRELVQRALEARETVDDEIEETVGGEDVMTVDESERENESECESDI